MSRLEKKRHPLGRDAFHSVPDLAPNPGTKVFCAVFLLSLGFALFTGHIWEDYWITFRASRNLATGQGLVFMPGERLHTFTSPLGTLLPAGLSWLTGNESDDLVLWLFRLVSIAAWAAAVVLLLRVLLPLQQHRFATWLTLALIGLDAKTMDFAINGMETGLLIFFLALTLHGTLVAGPHQWLRLGAGWSGLMWTRPDSCVYIGILAVGVLIFLRKRGEEGGGARVESRGPASSTPKAFAPNAFGARRSRLDPLRIFFKAGLVCTALYLPWFVWAWWYYGSPIPHTVMAKAVNAPGISPVGLIGSLALFPFALLTGHSCHMAVFLPPYYWFGGWPLALQEVGGGIAASAALMWPVTLLRPTTRLVSFSYFMGLFFLTAVVKEVYPWYLPTVATLGYLTIGLLFDEAFSLAKRLPDLGWERGWLRHLPRVFQISAIALVAGQALVTAGVARQMRVQQEIIEDGIRKQIGLWLRGNARSPQDTVFLEPLGYIGYFSQLKMLDWPGLSSREVVATRRRLGPEKENETYLELKPDWLVLRAKEATEGNRMIDPTRLAEFYELVRVHDARAQIDSVRWLPGKDYLKFDETFLIYRRKGLGIQEHRQR